jgi:cell division protein ZapE
MEYHRLGRGHQDGSKSQNMSQRANLVTFRREGLHRWSQSGQVVADLGSKMTGRVLTLYDERLRRGEIEPDPAQAGVAARLDDLAAALSAWRPARTSGFHIFRKGRLQSPRGLYIHGGVGRGKTMLMDLFYEAVAFEPKRRVHFHEFMAEVHDRIARGRATTDGDPIPFVAGEIAAEAALLCFDEMHVTDIADAMILGRLFKGLLDRGVVVVATSNSSPDRLYWNGLNRQLFLPFIEVLDQQLNVVELAAKKDFRLDKLAGQRLYFTPADAAARAELDHHWHRLTGNHPATEADLLVKGRRLVVPQASMGVARFSFDELCGTPLGASDYLQIAHAFHTLLIDGIPVLTPEKRNEARRLITLVDTLYDCGVCLIVSADAEPAGLYPDGDGVHLFERTASRLMEMRSEGYLAARAIAKRPT